MPYPHGHHEKTKKKIVASARKLFNRFGFDGVSINAIMEDADLTRGVFYTYFDSKSDLYAEVLECFFTDPGWKNTWKGFHIDLTAADIGPQIVRAYLSRQHLENVANSCPMVALPSDVARNGPNAKKAFERVFKAMVRTLERGLQDGKQPPQTTAQAIAAMCVGGMVIARAVEDHNFADQLRKAALTIALELGGWDSASRAKSKLTVASRYATTCLSR
jgi:TetR/AcrR family transcriptional regulator, transcriptional repressor for nem operon